MKKIYSSDYVAKEILEENNIDHPIKLEYYRIENETIKDAYGVEIVKTEYRENGIQTECEKVENITQDAKQIDLFLENISKGLVTPGFVKEIANDYFSVI